MVFADIFGTEMAGVRSERLRFGTIDLHKNAKMAK